MAKWSEIVTAEPEFARQVHAHFPLNTYATLATLRRDGSPRISGCSVVFATDGDLWIYAVPGSVRVSDLRRDPRLAVHSAAFFFHDDLSNLNDWPGDAKIAGYGIETVIDSDVNIAWDSSHVDLSKVARTYNEQIHHYSLTGFRIDVKEVVRVYGRWDDYGVIDSWHEGRGLRRREQRYPPESRVEVSEAHVEENVYGGQRHDV